MIGAAWEEKDVVDKLAKDQNARRVLLPHGHPPQVGELFHNPQMAAAYRLLAAQGAAAFYRGAIAKALLKTSQRLGGKMTAADLSDFESEWVEPIACDYHGWKVYELPPNGQGVAAIEMLNILSLFPLSTYTPRGVLELHTEIEAQKLAYQDLHRYVADTRFAKVPVEGMISMQYARERSALIDPDKAHCDATPGDPGKIHGDTIYLSVVDREGNIVSLIQSLYQHFGSGVVVDDYGFALQNRGGLFRRGPVAPQRARAAQAAFPHHHSGVHGEGRRAHRVRHHGRAEPGAGARAVRFQHGGPRDEHSARARSAALHQEGHRRVRSADRKPRPGGGSRRRWRPKATGSRCWANFPSEMGGGQVVMHNSATGVNFGASRPAQGRSGDPGAAEVFLRGRPLELGRVEHLDAGVAAESRRR